MLACVRGGLAGALPNCPGCRVPAPETTVFRAHGSGITLYGTVGRSRGHAQLLRAISSAVERPGPTRSAE